MAEDEKGGELKMGDNPRGKRYTIQEFGERLGLDVSTVTEEVNRIRRGLGPMTLSNLPDILALLFALIAKQGATDSSDVGEGNANGENI